jgi:hypothetical protein
MAVLCCRHGCIEWRTGEDGEAPVFGSGSAVDWSSGLDGYVPVPVPLWGQSEEVTMSDANVRIPAEARDRLARIASSEGMSLRGYLSHLAETLLTPEERAERAERARAALREWNGYDPSASEQAALDAELDRRLSEAGVR